MKTMLIYFAVGAAIGFFVADTLKDKALFKIAYEKGASVK